MENGAITPTLLTKRQSWLALIVILSFSLSGTALWLYEIVKIKGWYGLNWLNGTLYSPYISTFIAALSFVSPFLFIQRPRWSKLILAALVLYIINVLCYETGRQLCYAVYCRYYFWELKQLILMLLVACGTVVFLAFSYWFVADRLFKKHAKKNIFLLMLFVMMVIPLSLFTVAVIPGFGTGSNWIDSVKMGYPVFWMTCALGVYGLSIVRQKKQE